MSETSFNRLSSSARRRAWSIAVLLAAFVALTGVQVYNTMTGPGHEQRRVPVRLLPAGIAHVDACVALDDLPRSLGAIAGMHEALTATRDAGCLRRLVSRLADSAMTGGGERYYDAFASLASRVPPDLHHCYDSACVRLFYSATATTMTYLYHRSIGRYTALVSHMRNGLARQIGSARDTATARRVFENALNDYTRTDTAASSRLNAALLRAGVLAQPSGDR